MRYRAEVRDRCLSLCKDTNFKANHNGSGAEQQGGNDVCLCAKIRILKQITTIVQLTGVSARCLSLCKDTNFKANHNACIWSVTVSLDVCLCAKIRILKQITTIW